MLRKAHAEFGGRLPGKGPILRDLAGRPTLRRNVIIGNSRSPDSLGVVIAELGAGAEAGTTAQAAQAPLVVLATPWTAAENALAALPSWSGKTLVDVTNAFKVFDPPTFELFDFGDRTSSEVVASLAPGASVVKAFNHVPFMRLLSPLPDGEQHVLFVRGDDARGRGRPSLSTRSEQLRRHRPRSTRHRFAPPASGRPPRRAGSAPFCRRVTGPVLRCALARRRRASARQAGENDVNTDAPRRSHWLSRKRPPGQ